jgi:hypothetical protein
VLQIQTYSARFFVIHLRTSIIESIFSCCTAVTVTEFPELLSRGTRIVERGTLLDKGFSTVGTKLIHVPGTGTHVPGTWNVAPYHVPGDHDCSTKPISRIQDAQLLLGWLCTNIKTPLCIPK